MPILWDLFRNIKILASHVQVSDLSKILWTLEREQLFMRFKTDQIGIVMEKCNCGQDLVCLGCRQKPEECICVNPEVKRRRRNI